MTIQVTRKGWVSMARKSMGIAALAAALLAASAASAMTLSSDANDANIVELLEQSADIVVGKIAKVEDGLDEKGVPYTEVTLEISESIRGNRSGVYKFRQFGLLAPRLTADGKRKMMPSPTGFPKYTAGEDVALFLRPSAAWTGFRMPAGVSAGKFTIAAGRAENGLGNAGLFRNVDLDRSLVTERDKRLLTATSGPMNPDTFLSFVRRAVHGRWTETERLTRTDRRGGPRIVPRSEPSDVNDQTPAEAPVKPSAPAAPLDPNTNLAAPRSGR